VIRATLLLAAALLAAPALAQGPAPSDPVDFPDGPGRDETVTFCGACHSFRLVAAQGMTRERWDESLKWMVQRHNMPQLEQDELDVILNYLEKAFPPKTTGGRPGWNNPFAPKP
jgi:hypothetical protein